MKQYIVENKRIVFHFVPEKIIYLFKGLESFEIKMISIKLSYKKEK